MPVTVAVILLSSRDRDGRSFIRSGVATVLQAGAQTSHVFLEIRKWPKKLVLAKTVTIRTHTVGG